MSADLSPMSNGQSPNGARHADERPRRPARRARWVPVLLGLLLLGGGVAAAAVAILRGGGEDFNGPLWTVKKERLQLAIVERGALESAENSDIVCRVKQGKKNTATTIKWVIEDGAQVEKGQKLIELDDSALQEELKDQIILVNKARAEWVTAKDKCDITRSQNDSDIQTALTTLLLAQIELKKFLGDKIADKVLPIKSRPDLYKYVVGDLQKELTKQNDISDPSVSEILQTISDIQGRIEIERSNRSMAKDRAAWSQGMVNRKLLSRSQAEADRSRLESAEFALKKVEGELEIFQKFTVEQKVTELWSKVKEAERTLERTETQAKSKLNTDISDRDSKEDIFEQEYSRKLEIEDEIDKCTLYAPQSGLVVYHISEQSRWGGGTNQGIVAQGESVKEGQKLIRIPNLSRMLVNTRVHEAMVSRIKGEVLRPTGFSDSLRAASSFAHLPLGAAANIVGLNEVRSEFRDRDFDVLDPGQRCYVRVDAHSSKVFTGRVKSVATVASQTEFFSSDVKVYQTMVSIEESVINLKPGMSAEVTILAEESTEPVLTVPIQSVVGSIAMGANRKVYVIADGKPVERDIKIGRSNDKMVEVTEGIAEGDEVVLNPRPLLGEKSGMKVGTPGSRRGVETEDAGGGEGKKWGGKKGGGGFDPSKMKGGMPPGGFGPGGPGGAPPGGGPPGAGFNPAAPGGFQGAPPPGGGGKGGAYKKS
jgi:HlyD family secretion protein